MMNFMGGVYNSLGLYPRAQILQQQSMEIRRRVLGPEDPDTLKSMNSLALVLWHGGQYPEAEKLDRETLDIRRRVLGPEHPDTLATMNLLGGVLDHEGHYDEAEKLLRKTLDIRRRVLGPESPETAESAYSLGCIGARKGNPIEALSLLRQALDHGLDPPSALGMEKDPDLQVPRRRPALRRSRSLRQRESCHSPIAEIGPEAQVSLLLDAEIVRDASHDCENRSVR
ncbi:MAG: tetratricopeptide repeat protein [Candidatus Acidiferrales bacterium]